MLGQQACRRRVMQEAYGLYARDHGRFPPKIEVPTKSTQADRLATMLLAEEAVVRFH